MNFKNWIALEIDEHTSLKDWLEAFMRLNEATTATRYSVEINYRSTIKEVLEHFAKIVLGYCSAALKQNNFHIKHMYDVAPVRLLVASRNFDDGEWVGCITFNPEHDGGCFVLSKGFWDKSRKSVTSISPIKKCSGDSAADITKDIRNLMHELRSKPDKFSERLKPVNLKRGPKR